MDKVLGDAVCTLLFSWDMDDSPREAGICEGFCCLCPFCCVAKTVPKE